MSRNTGRKLNVINDELGYTNTSSGLYCIFPFAKLEDGPGMKGDQRKGVFKFGMTATSFNKRFDQYYHAFPTGVYIFALLSDIPIHHNTRSTQTTKKAWLLKAEAKLFREVIKIGGERIYSTGRMRQLNVNPDLGGVSEYVYCSIEQIHQAFTTVWEEFGGTLQLFNPEEKGADFNRDNRPRIRTARFVGIVPFV